MSRRKIKSRQNKDQNSLPVLVTNSVFLQNPITSELEIRDTFFEMTKEQAPYMLIYRRAHDLMPIPKSMIMDPREYIDELEPSIDVLKRSLNSEFLKTNEILRAIAILGHTPIKESALALAEFSESDHRLAKVAELAMIECTGLFSVFHRKIEI